MPAPSTVSSVSRINGSAAVVTGALSGIGRATAVALAERGADVVLAAPWLYRRLARRVMRATAVGSTAEPHGSGNVFEPMPEWNRVRGDWRDGR